jgi:Antirepressor regulating drug resistance, predicted signal transduction N-terminal membrane component
MHVVLPILIAAGLISSFAVWFLWGIETIVESACSLVRYCHSLLSRCVENYGTVPTFLFWAGGLVVAAGVVYGLSRAISGLLATRRALKRLPLKHVKGTSIILINDPAVSTAFTSGLLRPRIYISKGLIESLEGPELRAVFLHELHHKRRRDPLRFFLARLLRDTFFYIPVASHLERYLAWRKEHEADSAVVHSTEDPLLSGRSPAQGICPGCGCLRGPCSRQEGAHCREDKGPCGRRGPGLRTAGQGQYGPERGGGTHPRPLAPLSRMGRRQYLQHPRKGAMLGCAEDRRRNLRHALRQVEGFRGEGLRVFTILDKATPWCIISLVSKRRAPQVLASHRDFTPQAS